MPAREQIATCGLYRLFFLSGKVCLIILLLHLREYEMTESVDLNVLNILGCKVEEAPLPS